VHLRLRRAERLVSATVNGALVAAKRGRSRAILTVDLRGKAKAAYRLELRLRTATGRLVVRTRTYHTCLPKNDR
jgi:hypothetical protein